MSCLLVQQFRIKIIEHSYALKIPGVAVAVVVQGSEKKKE
jgi:hypothetical protein